MGVTIATTRVACNTSTGNQTITTTDLGGLTPKAALFVITQATADGSAVDDAVMGIGAADGTVEWAVCVTDEHGVTTSDSYNKQDSSNCVYIINATDGSDDGVAAFSSWTTNGVTINWSDAPAGAYLLTVTFFAGTDLSVDVDSASLGNTVDLETNITAPGFEPDIVIGVNTNTQSRLSYGVAHWDGVSTVTQRCIGIVRRDNRSTSECYSQARTDAIAVELIVNGTLDWYGEATNFDSSGFSIITRNAGGNNSNFKFLALNFGGVVDSAVWSYSTPGSTGSDTDTGPGFEPDFIQYLQQNSNGTTIVSDATAGAFGLAEITSTAQYNDTIASEDAVTTTNTQSLSDNQAVNFPDDDGTAEVVATFTAFTSTGVTLNYTTASALLWFGWGIGTAAAGDPEGPLVGGKLVEGGILAGRLVGR